MPKHRQTPDRILRKRLSNLIEQDAEKAKEYQQNHERTPKLPADQLYRVDPSMSRRPTAVCGNTLLGLPPCNKGLGKHCYCKIPCSNQYSLTSTDYISAKFVSEEAEAVSRAEMDAALEHAHQVMKYQRPELETEIDLIVENLIQSIEDEIKEGRK